MEVREDLGVSLYFLIPPRSLELTSYKISNGMSGSFESFPFLRLVAFLGAPQVVLRLFVVIGATSFSLRPGFICALMMLYDCWREFIVVGSE